MVPDPLIYSGQTNLPSKLGKKKSYGCSPISNLINLLLSPTTDAQTEKRLYFPVP